MIIQHHVLFIASASIVVRVLTVSALLLSSSFLDSFDESARLILSPSQSYLIPLIRWDTLYFLKIASQKGGYSRENEMAFLPGLPAVMHGFGWLLNGGSSNGLRMEQLIWAGVIGAGLAGISANIVLHQLSLKLFRNRQFALLISILFLIPTSPATLNAVPYTEPFAALFTFSGMYMYVQKKWWLASVFWCIGSGFRAQGIILGFGFFGWEFILGSCTGGRLNFRKLLIGLPKFAFFSVFSASSFLLYQLWCQKHFCRVGLERPWCDEGLGFSYGFIQSEYWNVGLFRYWTLQQIPNFLLASPVLAISFAASYIYYQHNLQHVLSTTIPFLLNSRDSNPPIKNRPFLSTSLTPFIHLHTALTFLLLFGSHVQIILRISATNPVIFWFVGDLIWSENKWGKRWIKYCVIWGGISLILWSGFYPPA